MSESYRNHDHPKLIKAYKHGWPRLAVDRMIRHGVRGGLHRVLAQGVARLRAELKADPSSVLLLANHSCWWDLFLVHVLNETLPMDGYGMMEHFNMLRFGFFRRIGAFSVDRTDPTAVRASLGYTASLLQRPGAGVWIFPQGRIECNDLRPITFQRGVGTLVRMAHRVRIVPVAFRYEFWQDQHPEALVRFGEPQWVDRADRTDLIVGLQATLESELDALKADGLTQDLGRFTTLLSGRRSISDRYAAFRARFRGQPPGASPLVAED